MQKFESVNDSKVRIENGFWHERQKLNRETTLYAVWDRFTESGRFDAFRMNWREGQPNRPHIFWDSDVAKLLEGAAYVLKQHPDAKLEAMVEETIDLIEKNQCGDGYFNIWYTCIEPTKRFTDRARHELYCAGHLFEAAVAYYEATGKDRFLRCMCRYADYIAETFMEKNEAAFETPGHQEIELALVRLYRCTQNEKYLALAKWFLDRRGNGEKGQENLGGEGKYMQAHRPVREQTKAVGHAVRACYMYCGMADVACETADAELLSACERLFENITRTQMYVTGGIGSTCNGEAFSHDFDLPNASAYNETCASIALAMFAQRMLQMKADARYADIVELELYNGFLSGTSLSGKAFFYENPLEIDLARNRRLDEARHKEHHAITERVELFSCSCCPPNIVRFVASIGGMLYTYNEDTIYLHQYMDSTANVNGVQITQRTAYPVDGRIKLTISGGAGKRIGVRVPNWCSHYTISAPYKLENGYAMIELLEDMQTITLNFDMCTILLESDERVKENAGKVAVRRGPIVYCAEAIDQAASLASLYVDAACDCVEERDVAYPVPTLIMKGWKKVQTESDALYRAYSSEWVPTTIRMIPYYTFANRGETDMCVWMKVRMNCQLNTF